MEAQKIGRFTFEEERHSRRFVGQLLSVHLIHEPGQYKQTLRGTAVGLVDPQGFIYVGVAVCSENENFNKRRGRQRALGLAFREVYRFDPTAQINLLAEDAFKQIGTCLRAAIKIEKDGILYERRQLDALRRERLERKIANLSTKRTSE